MDKYIKIHQKGDKYNSKEKHFNIREISCGGAARREYAKWCLKTDRGCSNKEAETYLDMLVLASD